MTKELTFAEQANKIKNKYRRGLENNDVFSTRAYKREMDRLIQEQEDFKAKNNLQESALQESMQQFSIGGGLNAKVAAERNRRGKDMTMAEVEAFLGKDYGPWRTWVEPSLAKTRGANESNADFNSMIYGDRFANLKDAPDSNTVEAYTPQDRSYMINPDYVPYKTNPIYDIATTGLRTAGQLTRDKASPVSFDRVGTNYVDYDPARRDIKQQIGEGRVDALSSIRGAGGTRSQQLRAMQGVSNGLSANEARALNESYMQQYNQNAGIRSQADAMNADTGARETMQNYADKRYVLENNNARNAMTANTLAQLPQQLKSNRNADMFLNTRDTKYGYDKDGNIINKQIPILTEEEKKETLANGGKIKKYKCGGKLRKR